MRWLPPHARSALSERARAALRHAVVAARRVRRAVPGGGATHTHDMRGRNGGGTAVDRCVRPLARVESRHCQPSRRAAAAPDDPPNAPRRRSPPPPSPRARACPTHNPTHSCGFHSVPWPSTRLCWHVLMFSCGRRAAAHPRPPSQSWREGLFLRGRGRGRWTYSPAHHMISFCETACSLRRPCAVSIVPWDHDPSDRLLSPETDGPTPPPIT